MQINVNKKGSKKRIVILSLTIITLIITGFVLYIIYQKSMSDSKTKQTTSQENKTDYNKPSQDQINQGNEIKTDTVNKTPTNNETNPNNSTNSIGSLTITRPLENESISNTLQIRTLIEGIDADSKCELNLSNANNTITKTVDIQALASSSTCRGFDIPITDLTSGEWLIKINITSGTSTLSATRKIKI